MATHSAELAHYALLEILPGATTTEVNRAWKRQIKIWHPDVNPHRREEATERTKQINGARDFILSLLKQPTRKANDSVQSTSGQRSRPSARPPRGASGDSGHRANHEEQVRWRAQPEPELSRSDSEFVQDHWYAHPERGKFQVLNIDRQRGIVQVRFRDGTQTRFVAATLWRTWRQHLHPSGYRDQKGSSRTRAEGKGTDRARWGEQAERNKQQAEEHRKRESEDKRRRDAERQALRESRLRAKREQEELLRKQAELRAQREMQGRGRRAQGKKHRSELLERRARETTDRQQQESEQVNLSRRSGQFRPRLDAPLSWEDQSFVTGHWYAANDVVFEVLGLRGNLVDIRTPDGRERNEETQSLWASWLQVKTMQRLEESRRRGTTSAGDLDMVRRIADQDGAVRLAQHLGSLGWAVLVDKRSDRGPLYVIPDERHRESIDAIFKDLKDKGVPVIHAKGGGGVSGGRPAWCVR